MFRTAFFHLCCLSLMLFHTPGFSQKNGKPEWVKNYPSEPDYYIGISKVSKKTPNYVEVAKQNALSELSNAISVNVSVTTVFSQEEKNKQFIEDFSEVINTATRNNIEHLEINAVWENKKEYWIYYKVNKADYQQNYERKKNEATKLALDFYNKGLTNDKDNQLPLALLNYTRALSTLSPYLSESITIQDNNGNTIYLINELINQLSSIYKELNVKLKKNIPRARAGEPFSDVELLTYRNNSLLANIPLKIISEKLVIIGQKHQSNQDGLCMFSTEKLPLKFNEIYQINVSVDFEELLKEATQDKLIIDLFRNVTPNVLNINVNPNESSLSGRFEENSYSTESSNIDDMFAEHQLLIEEMKQKSAETRGKSQFPDNKTTSDPQTTVTKNAVITDFTDLYNQTALIAFPNERLEFLKAQGGSIQLSSSQLKKIVQLMGFDNYKLQVVQLFMLQVTDKSKLYKTLKKEMLFAKDELKELVKDIED
ncbi:MAG TPA: DUF4476 domain-containing protein [Fluviicola sp.]|nr:DUF4476 domain-containing protein [Fluviicola sp.]